MDAAKTGQMRSLLAGLSAPELHEAWELVKEEMDRVRSQAVFNFRVGDKVSFKGRRGRTLTGTVERLGQKNLSVLVEQGPMGIPERWRVAPTSAVKAVA